MHWLHCLREARVLEVLDRRRDLVPLHDDVPLCTSDEQRNVQFTRIPPRFETPRRTCAQGTLSKAHACRRRSRKRSFSAKPIYSSTLRRISSHSPSPIERMCAGGRQLHVGKDYFAQRHTTSSTGRLAGSAAQRGQRAWRRGYTRVRLHWPQGWAAVRDPALTARRVGRTGPHANEAHGRGTREVQRPAVRQCAWVRAEGAGRPGLHRLVVHHALGELAHRHQRLAVVELLDDVHLQGRQCSSGCSLHGVHGMRHVACCLLHAVRGRSTPPRQPCICASSIRCMLRILLPPNAACVVVECRSCTCKRYVL